MGYFPHRDIYFALGNLPKKMKQNKLQYRTFFYLNQRDGISLARTEVIYCIIVSCN